MKTYTSITLKAALHDYNDLFFWHRKLSCSCFLSTCEILKDFYKVVCVTNQIQTNQTGQLIAYGKRLPFRAIYPGLCQTKSPQWHKRVWPLLCRMQICIPLWAVTLSENFTPFECMWIPTPVRLTDLSTVELLLSNVSTERFIQRGNNPTKYRLL